MASCAVAGFLAGRLTKPRERFYFIGEPVYMPQGAGPIEYVAPMASGMVGGLQPEATNERGDRALSADSICGAPTRSGRPCQRKVRGGGRCWQHRAKPRQ